MHTFRPILALALALVFTSMAKGQTKADWVALHRHYSASADSHHYNTTRQAPNSSYSYEGVTGYVSARAFQGSAPLIELYHDAASAYYYAVGEVDAQTMVASYGFRRIKTLAHVAANAQTGLVPLYHAYLPASNDNVYTTSRQEWQQALARGYRSQSSSGVKAYVSLSDMPRVLTTSLPAAQAGVSYQVQFQASANTSPLSWRLASGTLPLGLTLSGGGVLAGTPSTSGSYSFTLRVRDGSAYGNEASATLTLSIQAVGSTPRLAAPEILPAGGSFSGPVVVRLQVGTPGASIHYTLDGSAPTLLSARYSDPLTLSQDTTLRAGAFLSGYEDSTLAQASFSFQASTTPGQNPTPEALHQELRRLARAKRIPAPILAALLHVESGWEQFRTYGATVNRGGLTFRFEAGEPKLGYDVKSGRLVSVGIGLTQVTLAARNNDPTDLEPSHPYLGAVDVSRLRSDWIYNLEQGAEVLEQKWRQEQHHGYGDDYLALLEDDRDLLENWYYPLAAYNGSPLYVRKVWDALRDLPGALAQFYQPRDLLLPGDVELMFAHGQPFVARTRADAEGGWWLFAGKDAEERRYALSVHEGGLDLDDRRVVLDDSGTSTLGWPFADLGWVRLTGSSWHGGDDAYADDWSRKASTITSGQHLFSVSGGKVIFAGTIGGGDPEGTDFGKQVIVQIDATHCVRYAHLQDVIVSVGDEVVLGQSVVGTVGHTGGSFGAHLHIALYKGLDEGALAKLSLGRVAGGIPWQDPTPSRYAAPFYLVPRVALPTATGGTGSTGSAGGPTVSPEPQATVVEEPTPVPSPAVPAPSAPTFAPAGSGGGGGGCSLGASPDSTISSALLALLLALLAWRPSRARSL